LLLFCSSAFRECQKLKKILILTKIKKFKLQNGANNELLRAHGLRVLRGGGTAVRRNRRLRIPAGGQWPGQVQK